MAIDVALMRRARLSGEAMARVYSWNPATLSLGRNQRARGCYDLQVIASRGIGIVRRPTGGRAILHDREITYSVSAPDRGGSLRESFDAISALLVMALGALGVRAALAARTARAARPTAGACFEAPGEGELIAGGKKLAGSAQWREDGALLQHGSILVEDDQSVIGELMTVATAAPPRPATIRDMLDRPVDSGEFADALFSVIRAQADSSASLLGTAEVIDAGMSGAHVFEDEEWTWRR